MSRKSISNEKGFTLIEIIAVLVILGILAAVAVPRYLDMQGQARISAAQGAIAEVKAQATQFYAINLLRNGVAPPAGSILASVTDTPQVGSDFGVTFSIKAADSNGLITVGTVRGVGITTVLGTWIYPNL